MSGEQAKIGLTAAVAQALEDGLPALQTTLLFPADRLDELPDDRVARTERLRGPGRPKGAINRKTAEWVDALLNRYSSPLIGLAEIAGRRTLDLAAELGCKPLDALGIQLRAMAELAPYLHGKKPVEIAFSGALPVFVFDDPKAFALRQGTEAGLGVAEIESLGNQQLIEGTSRRVEQPELNVGEDAQSDQGDSQASTMIADHSAKERQP